MIYKNSDIPVTFNKIAEISDNYIIWVSENVLNNNDEYEAYIQFLNPSFTYIYVDDYKIKHGDSITINVNYDNNGYYNYVNNYDEYIELHTYNVNDDYITNDVNYKSDTISIFFGQILCCVCILWVFKQMSRLFFKGGLW